MLARRFLWVIAILVMLVIAAAFAYAIFGDRLIRAALVPTTAFVAPPPASAPDYRAANAWAARPDLPRDPARWAPTGFAAAPHPSAALFFVLPTGVFDRSQWNARIDDAQVNKRGDDFLRGQASLFNGVAAIWAPRYRQATFGAFLASSPDAARAIDLAYGDIAAAFDAFLAAQPGDRPIILAGHSQGALHLLHLLADRHGDAALMARIVAVYAPGWPVSVSADLPALGVPACASPDATGCLLVWQSFARPADPNALRARYDAEPGLTGAPRRGTAMLCVNPLTGTPTRAAQPPTRNFGALVPNGDFSGGEIVARGIGAQCRADGLLDIGDPPGGYSAFILPGNNFHAYDFHMFWANLRADAERRVGAFAAAAPPAPRHANPAPAEIAD